MAVALKAVVKLDPRCDGGENGAVYATQGMEESVIEAKGKGLSIVR